MSSFLLRLSANARELAKRSVHAGIRSRSTDAAAAAAAPRQTDPKQELVQQKLAERFESQTKRGDVVPAFKRALLYGNKTAIKDESGEFTYAQLFCASQILAKQLSQLCGTKVKHIDLFASHLIVCFHFSGEQNRNRNIAFLCPNTAVYSVVQWACWISGHTGTNRVHSQPSGDR